ncbi:MAG: rhomboid family intramembrane serine protease [Candidatus Obscuribacterales bacterium]|nr:rhomboid family intramembrane serine protease [Candidatus Obscuribacterales bacterium]
MSQYSIWLWILVTTCILGLIARIRIDWRWTWGFSVQQILIACLAVIGLTVGPQSTWAFISWTLFLVFYMGRLILSGSIAYDLSLLRAQQALKKASFLKIVLWGPPGEFWHDLALLENDYLRGDQVAAQKRSEKWRSFWSVPKVQELLTTYNLLGKSLIRDWQGVVNDFAASRLQYDKTAARSGASYPVAAALAASRAYAELGQFDKCIEILEACDLPAANYSRLSLDSIFLSFFALFGSTAIVERILKDMSKLKGGLPDFARTFWQAHAESTAGNFLAAHSLYNRALSEVPAVDKAWFERISYQLKLTEEKLSTTNQDCLSRSDDNQAGENAGTLLPERKAASARAEAIMRRCLMISDIIYGGRQRKGVKIVALLLALVFFITAGAHSFKLPFWQNLYAYSFAYGALAAGFVLQGEWWRLLTYQFLHANVSHLFMNLFGLIWLGKFVENIFGTKRFLVIYFGSGFLSGLAQMLISPEQIAVGASGAVMGIFGASAAATVRLKDVLPPRIRKAELNWMFWLALMQVTFDQVINFVSAKMGGHGDAVRIASFAHIGGMISGFILGFMLPLKKFEE